MILDFPRLAWHVAANYLLRRQRKPFMASVKLTYCCNLRCLQCPYYQREGPQMSFEQALAVFDRLRERGSRIAILEGGEPMLWKDGTHTIHELVREAKKRFPRVGMTTNGTFPLDAPVDALWVSLDGLQETHDRLRGAPVFERVIANIRASRHPRLYAHITVNSQNAEEVPELVRFLSGLVRGMTVQFYYPYGGKDNLFLDPDRRAKLIDELIALKKSGLPVLNSTASLQALQAGAWRCDDWLDDNADPDGTLHQGCYLRGRGDINCALCGFTPHIEASLAYQRNLESILAGLRIFFF